MLVFFEFLTIKTSESNQSSRHLWVSCCVHHPAIETTSPFGEKHVYTIHACIKTFTAVPMKKPYIIYLYTYTLCVHKDINKVWDLSYHILNEYKFKTTSIYIYYMNKTLHSGSTCSTCILTRNTRPDSALRRRELSWGTCASAKEMSSLSYVYLGKATFPSFRGVIKGP